MKKLLFPLLMMQRALIDSNFISNASGSVDGLTFSRNKGGLYIKKKSNPVNPNTPQQNVVRARLQSLANSYRSLSVSDRNAWADAAENYPVTNRLGKSKVLTGQQLYQKLNLQRLNVGLAVITNPLAPVDLDAPVIGTSSLDLTSGIFSIGFSPDPIPANTKMLIEATAPLSSGVNAPSRSRFKRIDVIDAAASSPQDVTTAYEAVFGGSVASVGDRIFFRLSFVSELTGQQTSRIQGSVDVIQS